MIRVVEAVVFSCGLTESYIIIELHCFNILLLQSLPSEIDLIQ